MRTLVAVLVAALGLAGGCALHADLSPEGPSTRVTDGIQNDRCSTPPDAPSGSFRKGRNRLFASLGHPHHRGTDLIAVEGDEKQTLGGKLAYTAADTDLAGEDVELFACVDRDWLALGRARTDGGGRFELVLEGSMRLPVGTRDLYAHVVGDGSGMRFLAYVAAHDESVIVIDIDGTLTESENAIVNTVLFGDDIAHRRGAPAALAASHHTVVYVTARGDQYTEITRRWLHDHGFPRGPLRLARATLTSPGPHAIRYKVDALRALHVPVSAAIGNKRTDVIAYTTAGVPAARIFVKLPEFEAELREDLAAHRAIGFSDYRLLPALLR